MSYEIGPRADYLMNCDEYLAMIDRFINKLNQVIGLKVCAYEADLVIGSVIIWTVYELLIEVENYWEHGRDNFGNGYPEIVPKKIDDSHAIIPCGCIGALIIDDFRRINIHNIRPKDDYEAYAYFGFDGSPTKKFYRCKPIEMFKNVMAMYIPPQYLDKNY